MLYYLFEILEKEYQLMGASLFQYISFRSAISFIFSLLISTIFGKKIINFLRKKQIGDNTRELNLPGEKDKEGTPTMGGLIILLSTIIPILLFSDFKNIYILILIFSLLWLSIIGFIDDYIKVFKKRKSGINSWVKIIGQTILGLFIGLTVYFHPEIEVKQNQDINPYESVTTSQKSLKTTIPFIKNNELDYVEIFKISKNNYNWIFYVLVIAFIIIAVSNGSNLTDGLDGLATGNLIISFTTLTIISYLAGNFLYSSYLYIPFVSDAGEITVFISCLIGALLGFLWFNSNPAEIFMGDAGSIPLGGILGLIAILIKQEFLLILIGGIFVIEAMSVILQIVSFKLFKKRIFIISPIHHHFEKLGIPESKIVIRFWIIGILFSLISFATLKIR